MQFYIFYKKYGLRTFNITKGKLPTIPDDTRPAEDVVGHWMGFEGDMGPSQYHLFTRYYPSLIRPVFETSSNLGRPRNKNYNHRKYLKLYTRSIPKMKVMTTPVVAHLTKSKNVVYTYAPLLKNQSYSGVGSDYNKYYNVISTMLQKCNDVADEGLLNIIHLNLPKEPMDDSWYKQAAALRGHELYKKANSGERVFMIELHRWLNSQESVFNVLDEESINTLNMLWVTSKGSVLVNLSSLHAGEEGDLNYHIEYLKTIGVNSRVSAEISSKFTSKIGGFNMNYGADTNSERDVQEVPVEFDPVSKTQETIEKPTEEVLEEDKEAFSEKDIEGKLQKELVKQLKGGFITPNKRTAVNKAIARAKKELNAKDIEYKDLELENKVFKPLNENSVPDKTMYKGNLKSFDDKYIHEILDKDIIAVYGTFARAGVIINEKSRVVVGDITGSKQIRTLEVQPIDGDRSTLKAMLPIFDKHDNTFMNNSNSYRMKKQMSELPIRKVQHDQVNITSYYGKLFITRSRLAVDNEVKFLSKWLLKLSFGSEATIKVTRVDVFDKNLDVPLIYGKLMMTCSLLVTKKYKLNFIHKDRHETVMKGKGKLSKYEKDGAVVVGRNRKTGGILIIDKHDVFHDGDKVIGSIYDILGISHKKTPVDLAVCRVLGKSVSLGLLFGYWIGLSALFRKLKVEVVTMKVRQRQDKDIVNPMVMVFKDVKVVVVKASATARMIIQGFVKEAKIIKELSYREMDIPGTYGHIFKEKELHVRYLREVEMIEKLFIDPMTKRRLVRMGEPTEMKQLCIRAVNMLETTKSPRPYDGKLMVIKGYERVAGAVYAGLCQATRGYKNQYNSKRKALEMSPYAIWQGITQDPSVRPIEDTNPLQYLKEIDGFTLNGTGGLSARTLTIQARRFDPNSLGIVSEASLDNGDVGGSGYLSVNPQMNDVMGMNDSEVEMRDSDPTASFSTSYLLNPFSDSDDPKRTSFAAIQASHTIGVDDYELGYVRTGYDSILPYKVGKLFATMAKQDGKVTSMSKNTITVTYKDGTKVGVPIGNQYGKAEGSYYPHNIITGLKKGDKVKNGSPIAWNKAFFKHDSLSGNLTYTQSTMCRVALVVITEGFSKKLFASIGKVRDVTIDADTRITNMVKVGDNVEIGDKLMLIESNATAGSPTVNRNEATSALDRLTNTSPSSEFKGLIDRIEVYYNCNISDMSASIKKITVESDKHIASHQRALGRSEVTTGKVTDNFKVKGRSILPGEVVIRIYYILRKNMVTGDKVVFANQLKTTIGEVVSYKMTSQTSKKEIGAMFSLVAIGARIVISPFFVGFLGSYLEEVPNHLMKLYRK